MTASTVADEPRKGPTLEPIAHPPGYFRVARTGRVHRVERAYTVTWPDGSTWIAIDYWCRNIGSTRKGALSDARPDGIECARCTARLYGPVPRVTYGGQER